MTLLFSTDVRRQGFQFVGSFEIKVLNTLVLVDNEENEFFQPAENTKYIFCEDKQQLHYFWCFYLYLHYLYPLLHNFNRNPKIAVACFLWYNLEKRGIKNEKNLCN